MLKVAIMMNKPRPAEINCPIVSLNALSPCPPEELDPLLAWLREGERPVEERTYWA